MIVAIPSKGRAGDVRSQWAVPSATVFVPCLEIAAYEGAGAMNVIGVPDEVLGITATRNWILDWAKEDPWVVFIDDDLRTAGWIEMEETRSRRWPMDETDLLAEWVKLFEVMEAMKFRIWGVATISAPRAVYPYRPFIFQTYVTASCMGILNRGLRFDESFPVKEDYEICLRCIQEDGGILGARYLYWENDHWRKAGGCREYRTGEMEEDVVRRLMEKYPGLIRRVRRGGSEWSVDLEF